MLRNIRICTVAKAHRVFGRANLNVDPQAPRVGQVYWTYNFYGSSKLHEEASSRLLNLQEKSRKHMQPKFRFRTPGMSIPCWPKPMKNES